MNYPKSLFFNFLTVFFANHILPGIEVMSQTKLPHLGHDILFAIVVGVLNSLIYPALKLIDRQVNAIRIAAVALIMNFAIYAILKVIPVEIHVSSLMGYLIASFVVSVGGFTTNYLALRSKKHHHDVSHLHSHHSDVQIHSSNQDDTKAPE